VAEQKLLQVQIVFVTFITGDYNLNLSTNWLLTHIWYNSPMNSKQSQQIYGGIIWLLSGLALTIYAVMGLKGKQVYGVEELFALIQSAEGGYIYLAAFVSIFIEGLYFFGSFFPGGTLIVIIVIVSQILSWKVFTITILTIFSGWCLVGALNIYLAKYYRKFILDNPPDTDYQVTDKIWLTWFPSFRANHEVAQVTEGAVPWEVFVSSVRVKIIASIGAAIYTLLLPLFVNIEEVSNEEGFWSMCAIAIITFTVGIWKIRQASSESSLSQTSTS